MKTFFKLISKKAFFFLLFLFAFAVYSKAQPYTATVTVNYNNASLTPGANISVPILINAQSQVYGYDLNIIYNKDILTYQNFTFVYPSGQSGGMGVVSNANGVTLSFLPSSASNYTYTNQEVCDLNFTFNGGSTAINVSLIDMFDLSFNMFTITAVNGSAGGSYADITSVAAGGDWATATTWDKGHIPNSSNGNVIINSSSSPVTISTATSWPRNVTINSGKYLTASATFSVGGTFTINNGGSFIDNNSNSLTAAVQRTMTGNWTSGSPGSSTIWHAVSSPVQSQSNNIFNGSLMNQWNEVTQNWDPLTLPYVTMPVGKGYIVAPTSGGITAAFSGTLNTGSQTMSGLTKTGSTTWSGFNLAGNPFASAIQWNTGITVTNVANYAWLWNGSAYIVLDRTIGTGVIPAEQGFFVQATGSGSFTIPNANRVHSAQAYYKSGISDLLTLKVDGNDYWDQTQIRILPGSGESYNVDYDALKFPGSDAAPQLYSYKQDVQLSILSLPSLNVYPIIQLGFKPGAAGNFTITASDLETFASGTNVYLEDLLTGRDQDLQVNPVYEFNAVAGQPEHRFNLHFAALGVPEASGSNIRIYSNEQTIYVNIPSAMNGDILVYNLLGSEVAHTTIIGNSLNKLSLNVTEGVYVVRVNGDTGNVTGKVFIR